MVHTKVKLLFLFSFLSLAFPFSFVMVDDQVLVHTADVIIEGEVVSFGPTLYASMPATEYTVAVNEILKGENISSTIVVTVPGGFDPNNVNVSLHLHGAPNFGPGEKVILFLVQHKGLYLIQHFALGAFHEVQDTAGTSFATRAIDDRSEDGSARNFARFKNFIRNVLKDTRAVLEKNYYEKPSDNGGFRSLTTRYNLFYWGGLNVRWFAFDQGQAVPWYVSGQISGYVGGGGTQEVDDAIHGWNDEPSTNIRYNRVGATNNVNGLTTPDDINSIVFEDPTEYMYGPFDCASGGLLAMGGYWSNGETLDFHGTSFVKITQGDIVVQDGIACWINGASSPRNTLNALLAHELGHTLGMLHSCGDDASGPCYDRPDQDNALMRAYIGYDRGPVPGVDDIAAIRYLYGESETTSTGTTGTHGITVDLWPTSDAFVRSGAYAANNYGREAVLEVKDTPVLTDYTRQAYLRYDLSGVQGQITSATLSVSRTSDSLPVNFDISLTSNDWEEYGITWNNKPAIGNHIGTMPNSATTSIDMSSVTPGSALSLLLWDSARRDQQMRLISKEGAPILGFSAPVLRITYLPSSTSSSTTSSTSSTIGSTSTSSTIGSTTSSTTSSTSSTIGSTSTSSTSSTIGSTSTSSTSGTGSTTGGNNYIDLLPTDDSFIRSGVYSGNNYGREAALEIKDTAVRTDFTREAFLKFDMTSVTRPVTAVQLIVTPTADSFPLDIDVSVMPDTWTETTVIWNNQPAVGQLVGTISNTGIATLNIQGLQSVWNDKIVSFQLWDSKKVDKLYKIVSKEGNNAAKLRVFYESTSTTSGSTTGGSTTGGANYYEIYPTMDSYVRGGGSANANFGADTKLAVKSVAGTEEYSRDSYLKFDLAAVSKSIKSAKLIVKMVDTDSLPLNFDVAVVANDNWAENTVTWANKPGTGSVVGHVGNDGNANLDVGVLNSVSGDKIVTIRLFDSRNQDALMNVYSREAAAGLRPMLRIEV